MSFCTVGTFYSMCGNAIQIKLFELSVSCLSLINHLLIFLSSRTHVPHQKSILLLSTYIIKDTAFSAGCTPYNLELPTSPPTTQPPTTTANPCGSDYKCESTSAYTYCIKPFQVKFFKLIITHTF